MGNGCGVNRPRKCSGEPGDWRAGGMQGDPGIPNTHASLRIGCGGSGKSLEERWLEMLQLLEPAAELRVDGWPRDGRGLAQLVASPREPDVDVQAHGTVVQLPDRGLQQR